MSKIAEARPPRNDVFRAASSLVIGRSMADAEVDGDMLSGHFAVFNTWTEINSWEGRFLERLAPGAFTKTFKEASDQIRVLLQHGYDPELGDKPIADIVTLREDEEGAYFEARMLDGVPELVLAGLRAGLYGASFRFQVMREDYVSSPDPSDENPHGLPERTLKEVAVREFGPVTWGAYPTASAELAGAGMRCLKPGESLSEEATIEALLKDPERFEAKVHERTSHLAAFGTLMERVRAEVAPLSEIEAVSGAVDLPELFVTDDGEEYLRDAEGNIVERSWDDPEPKTSVAPAAEARRDEDPPGGGAERAETGNPEAPAAASALAAVTRKGKDYLSPAEPAWRV